MMKDILFPVFKDVGVKIMAIYDTEFEVRDKGENSPVTKADLIANELICDFLRKNFDYPILSEESEDDLARLNAERLWILDPLDGTSDFVQKTGEFSIMLGLVEGQRPIFGMVYQPVLGRLFWAEKGKGAYVVGKDEQEKRMKVSDKSDFGDFSAIVSRNHLQQEVVDALDYFGVGNMKKCGSNGIKVSIIANGEADLFFNTTNRMGEWDGAAVDIIIHEAGGKMTGTDGELNLYNKEKPNLEKGIVASNGVLHDEVVSYLKKIA